MISLDTETTGIDLHHGAKPFLVTSCNDDDNITFWEWDVNPLTRQPIIPRGDWEEVIKLIADADGIAGQNLKFDIQALNAVRPDDFLANHWPWHKTVDTLFAAHLLASNQPHDLTSLALIYLGINIQPYEDRVEKAVKEALKIVVKQFPTWAVAIAPDEKKGKPGRPDMPSAKKKVWKFDMWLPRAVAKELNYPDDHPWWTVTSEYANMDSAVTLPLYKVMLERIKLRDLEAIYRERLKLMRITCEMEQTGVTLNETRLDKLYSEYSKATDKCRETCLEIAEGELDDLPVGSVSNALKNVIFNKLGLISNKKTKSKNDSMDKDVLEHWVLTEEAGSPQHTFVKNLQLYRKRMTSMTFMKSYRKFWRPWVCVQLDDPVTGAGWYVLHPSLNPTGTDTLRWSCSNPNEQNISKKLDSEGFNLRYLFGPAPGREWWSCDAKNIELRIPAYEAGEQLMIDLFERPDDPPYYGSVHMLNFDTLHPEVLLLDGLEKFKKVKDDYDDTWYQWTKNGDFAVQYGAMAASGTADRAFHVQGGQAKIEQRLGRINELNQRMIAHATEHGYVETMPDKTVDPKHGYPLLCTRTKWGGIMPTVPLSYHVQGTAMWWMMKAQIRCQEQIDEWNTVITNNFQRQYEAAGHSVYEMQRMTMDHLLQHGFRMTMQVHDEIVFDFPKGTGKEPWKTNLDKIRRLQTLMSKSGDDIGVPTPTSCKYHADNWSKGLSL